MRTRRTNNENEKKLFLSVIKDLDPVESRPDPQHCVCVIVPHSQSVVYPKQPKERRHS